MAELPEFLRGPVVFWSAQNAHDWTVERLRQTLGTPEDFFRKEACRLLQQEGAPMDDEEYLMAEHQQNALIEMLEEAHSYMWGLAVAGIFHQWERDTRKVVLYYNDRLPQFNLDKLDKVNFAALCTMLEHIGFEITNDAAFPGLRLSNLIANTIKHGDGRSFAALLADRPDLFQKRGWSLGSTKPDDLCLTQREFDVAAVAISETWVACRRAVSQ